METIEVTQTAASVLSSGDLCLILIALIFIVMGILTVDIVVCILITSSRYKRQGEFTMAKNITVLLGMCLLTGMFILMLASILLMYQGRQQKLLAFGNVEDKVLTE